MKTTLKDACDKIKKEQDLVYFIKSRGIYVEDIGDNQHRIVCPFHNDTDPSLYIGRPNDFDIWNCFGCKKKGSIIDFYMYFYHVSIIEAVKALDPNIEFEVTADDYRVLRMDLMNKEKIEQLKAKQNEEYFELNNFRIRAFCYDFFETCKFNKEEIDFVHKHIFYPLDVACDNKDPESMERIDTYAKEELSKRENKYAMD